MGFYTSYDRNYHHIGIRGFGRSGDYNARVVFLIDGHRITENVGGSNPIGTDFHLDVDLIKRIEIIRGPISSLYGDNAFFGVINIVTKGGADNKGLELSSELASFDTERGRITYGNVLDNDLELLISSTYFNRDGEKLYFKEFDDPSTYNGRVKNDDDQFYNLFVKASIGDWSLTATNVQREKGIPTAPWETEFGDSRTRNDDDYTLIGLTYNHDFSDKFSVNGKVSYNHYNWDGRWIYDDGDGPYMSKEWWKGRWWQSELNFVAQPLEKHKLSWGAEFRYNIRQDQRSWDEWSVNLNDQRHSRNWGIYIQDEFKAFDNLIFVGALRYDENNTLGNITSPRFAMIYKHSEKTFLKLLYGEAFRSPNVYELYYQDGGVTAKSNPNLSHETATTYEAVLEQYFDRNLRGTVSGFYCSVEDYISQITDPADDLLVFRNLGEIKSKGVELGLDGKWDSGWQGRASYSYVLTEDVDAKRSLVNSPRHLAKFNVIAPVIKNKLFAGIETQYSSKARTLTGHHADDFTVVNLTLTCVEIMKGLEISASVYNLFDKEYGTPGSSEHAQDIIIQDGRSYGLRLIYRF